MKWLKHIFVYLDESVNITKWGTLLISFVNVVLFSWTTWPFCWFTAVTLETRVVRSKIITYPVMKFTFFSICDIVFDGIYFKHRNVIIQIISRLNRNLQMYVIVLWLTGHFESKYILTVTLFTTSLHPHHFKFVTGVYFEKGVSRN